jgi:hypothetical protein
MFNSFKPKLYHWLVFTKDCFQTYNPLLKDSRELSKIVKRSLVLLKESNRSAIIKKYSDHIFAHIVGMYLTILSWHEGIQLLGLSNQRLNMLAFLRPELDALLIFLFFLEPKDNVNEIEKRVNQYIDWIKVKMFQNMERSSKLSIVDIIPGMEEYKNEVRANYEKVKEKYKHLDKEWRVLEATSSFLSNKNKLAKLYGIEDFYNHVYTEASATIHIADISDRMQYYMDSNKAGYIYDLTPSSAFWQLALSNKVLIISIEKFAKFFGLERQINKLLNKVFKDVDYDQDKIP